MRLVIVRSVVLIASLTAVVSPAPAQQTARATANDCVVYLRPDASSPIVLTVAAGTVLDVSRKDGEWYAVLLPADAQGLRRLGYVATTWVELLDTQVEPRLTSSAPQSQKPIAPPQMPSNETPLLEEWAGRGTYLGVNLPFHRFRGNGEDILFNGSDLLIVPTLKSEYGWAIVAGHVSGNNAIEISYSRSQQASTATFSIRVPGLPSILSFEEESVYHRVNVDYKRYLVRRWRAQPYILFGVGFPWLKVTDGGFVDRAVVDASYSGVGADAGAGVTFFAHPRIAVHGGAIYRYDFFLSARGGDGDWSEIQDTIAVHGLNVTTGLSIHF